MSIPNVVKLQIFFSKTKRVVDFLYHSFFFSCNAWRCTDYMVAKPYLSCRISIKIFNDLFPQRKIKNKKSLVIYWQFLGVEHVHIGFSSLLKSLEKFRESPIEIFNIVRTSSLTIVLSYGGDWNLSYKKFYSLNRFWIV